MSAAMRRAVAEGLIKSNPCSVKGAQGATSGKSVGVPTLDQVKALANNINPRFRTMVLLMAFGGFRFGGVTELRRGDVREISVHGKRAYCFQVERAVTLVNTGKSKCIHHIDKPKSAASVREVVVTSSLTAKIDELLESLPESEEALLFPAASGSDVHLRHDVFMNSWRPAMVRAGIPAGLFSPHGLRHFAGTHLHMAGATIAELKEWLGDSSTAAVMRYVHSTGRTPGIADKMAKQEDFA